MIEPGKGWRIADGDKADMSPARRIAPKKLRVFRTVNGGLWLALPCN